MKNYLVYSIIFPVLIATGCGSVARNSSSGKATVAPLSDTSRLRNTTLIYALPMTVLTARIELDQTIELPGPYSRYADELLGLKDVIKQESESWALRAISLRTHEEADPSEYYLINSNDIFTSNALALRKEGLILDITSGMGKEQGNEVTSDNSASNSLVLSDLGSDEYFSLQTDTAFRRVSVDSTFIRIPYIIEKRKKLTADQLAERAARRLMELRDGKFLIMTGEANVFPQSSAPVDELNRMEKELTELFTGKSFTRRLVFYRTIIPKAGESDAATPLFYFSESRGPSETSSALNRAVTISFTPEQKTKDITLLLSGSAGTAGVGNGKLYFRIPDMATVKIKNENELLYSSRIRIGQFGEIMQLPANFLLKD
jgi:Domain of unknown function (DUF4831)